MYIDLGSLLTPLVEWHYVMSPNPFQLVHHKTWAESPMFFPFIFLDGSKSLPLPSLSVVYSLAKQTILWEYHISDPYYSILILFDQQLMDTRRAFSIGSVISVQLLREVIFLGLWWSLVLTHTPTIQHGSRQKTAIAPGSWCDTRAAWAVPGASRPNQLGHRTWDDSSVIACIFCCILHSVSFKTFMHMLCV